MEKVKLTKEQAEAIGWLKDEGYSIGDILNSHIYGWSAESIACLNKLKISQVAEVLYEENYEIEPEQPKFQPGDKVIVTWNEGEPTLHEVQGVRSNTVYINTKPPHVYNSNPPKRIVRHATLEEIYWLETFGREKVGDFRIGDIYIDREYRAEILENDRHVQLARIWYDDGDFKGLYPAESFKPFPKESTNAHHR